jgi:indole-3-glycerol phosphate synthase
MNILEEIVAYKKKEVSDQQLIINTAELEASPFFRRSCLSLKASLLNPSKTGIIAEFKRRSPSKGSINTKVPVEEVTSAYTRYGASGISVLTDKKYFGGSSDDLSNARGNNIPILRKDFIIDEYQLFEAKAMGADVILLIAACLSPVEVKRLAAVAKRLGLEVLLEIHNESELDHICDEVDIVGVNNRNLKTFEVNIQNSLRLIKMIPSEKIAVSESGISEINTIIQLKDAGFKGFLIGENFMKQSDPSVAFADFANQLKAKSCG